MAIDPRKYTITKCIRGPDSAKRDFFSDVGKVGNLEILNDVGLGKVGEGLRILGAASDVIRTGTRVIAGQEATKTYDTFVGKIMGTARDAVNEGAQAVLDAMGLGTAVGDVGRFAPEVANRAWGQAKDLYSRLKDGKLDWRDLPSLAQDFQNLESLARGIYTPDGIGKTLGNNMTMCDPSPYATDLIAYAPKFKFLFVVEIEWNPTYAQHLKDIEAAFVIKSSSRPNVNVEYEDINMYNFKTQVPRRVMYQPMTMRFYDDNWNQAMILWNAYLKAISPISNMDFTDQGIAGSGVLEASAMDFKSMNTTSAYSVPTHDYAASYGLPNKPNEQDIFKQINLYHVYREGRLMNVYQFYNPRIENFVLDDVDMADGSSGNEVEISFKYDALNVTTGIDTNPITKDTKWDLESVSGSNGRAIYPIIFNGSEFASSNCINKDINIHGKSSGESRVTEAQESQSITSTADGLLGQFGKVGDFLDKAAGGLGKVFETMVNDSQLSGNRQAAQRGAANSVKGDDEGNIIRDLF